MSRDQVYFISDAHLGAPNPVRRHRAQEDALIGFLRSIRDDADVLYVVGDLFDFWFEYHSVVPVHGARVLFELYGLVQAGVRVVYLPGNHDIWLGAYLQEQVGLELTDGPIEVVHQGRRLFLAHGDEFRGDLKFWVSRAVLKHPVCIRLFRWLHPDLGAFLARRFSRFSDHRGRRRPDVDPNVFLTAAEEKIAAGADLVICGHYHRVLQQAIGAGRLIILGDWVKLDTYAVLADGEIEVKRWEG